MMNTSTFLNISKIIQRDSKTTTYKFALLRGVIDIVVDNSPFINVGEERITVPLGLLVEKWLVYYYPIFSARYSIPQINSETKLAFQDSLLEVIAYYDAHGGLSAFYNDLRGKGISAGIAPQFQELVVKLKNTITRMPMRYIGKSVTDREYSIFDFQSSRRKPSSATLNTEWLIEACGDFSFPREYYDAFSLLGSFLSGTDNILFKWAEFSVDASKQTLSTETIVHEILKSPITERDVVEAKSVYKTILQQEGHVQCAWSGRRVDAYDVDHVIPFSVWKNNDLWNLLPVHPKVNNEKRDRIPTPEFLETRRDSILHYWDILKAKCAVRFSNEMRVSLLGKMDESNWHTDAFQQLKSTSEYLINVRGFEAWTS